MPIGNSNPLARAGAPRATVAGAVGLGLLAGAESGYGTCEDPGATGILAFVLGVERQAVVVDHAVTIVVDPIAPLGPLRVQGGVVVIAITLGGGDVVIVEIALV